MSPDTAFAFVSYPPLEAESRDRSEDQSRARGHAAGYLAGLRAAAEEAARLEVVRSRAAAESAEQDRERVDRALAAMAAATLAIEQRSAPVAAEVRSSVGAAAVQLAEAMLAAELSDPVRAASCAIDRALVDVDPSTVKAVRMHPADLAVLEQLGAAPVGIRLLGDPTLVRGDAVTEFDDGYLDACLTTAVGRVRAALGALS